MQIAKIVLLAFIACLAACSNNDDKGPSTDSNFSRVGEDGCQEISLASNEIATYEFGEGTGGFTTYRIFDDGSVAIDSEEAPQETYVVENGEEALASLLGDLETTGINEEPAGCYTCDTDDDPFGGWLSYRKNGSVTSFSWLDECVPPKSLEDAAMVIQAYISAAKSE